MPNIKSAKKRVDIAERNRRRNQAYKSAIRTAIKRVHEGVTGKIDVQELQARVSKAYSLIDKAVLKGIVHKNAGARYKSRVMKALNKTQAA